MTDNICPHCKLDKRIRNPSGFCDHLYYPEYCKICKYNKGDEQNMINDLNEEEILSIQLGFNGEKTPAFYNKLESVKKVRNRIMNDYYYSVAGVIIFSVLGIYLYKYPSDFAGLFTLLIIFDMICFVSIFVHLKIILEWTKHDKEMVKEWMKKNTTTQNVGCMNTNP